MNTAHGQGKLLPTESHFESGWSESSFRGKQKILMVQMAVLAVEYSEVAADGFDGVYTSKKKYKLKNFI